MKYNQKEKISFECTCRVEELTVSYSEKSHQRYAKIVSVEGNCFFCFNESLFMRLSSILENLSGSVSMSGEVSQRRGGTFLSVQKVHYRDLTGGYVSIEKPEEREETK